MRGLLFALISTVIATGPAMALVPRGTDVRAMTYNIRLDLASDGNDDWAHRKDMVASVIRHEAPDLLGMQEVLQGQKEDLERANPEYRLIGVARDDGAARGEYSPIAFRRDRYKLIESGTFWLSPTPDTPSKGWDAAYPRIATWAVLRDRKSRRSIRVLNTHFDHLGNVARRESAALIVRWLRQGNQSNLPTILMGDLNSTRDDPGYQLFAATSASGLRDSRSGNVVTYGPPGTFNGFKIASDEPLPIDHIFVSRHFAATRHSVVTQHWGGRLPSDHYPVVVDLVLSPATSAGAASRR
jgi:endonuclease/exonuclease/phosphatase family metal-dependent hydrolase